MKLAGYFHLLGALRRERFALLVSSLRTHHSGQHIDSPTNVIRMEAIRKGRALKYCLFMIISSTRGRLENRERVRNPDPPRPQFACPYARSAKQRADADWNQENAHHDEAEGEWRPRELEILSES